MLLTVTLPYTSVPYSQHDGRTHQCCPHPTTAHGGDLPLLALGERACVYNNTTAVQL